MKKHLVLVLSTCLLYQPPALLLAETAQDPGDPLPTATEPQQLHTPDHDSLGNEPQDHFGDFPKSLPTGTEQDSDALSEAAVAMPQDLVAESTAPPSIGAGTVVWTWPPEQELQEEIEWFHHSTQGIVLLGTANATYGIEGSSGRQLWSLPYRTDLPSILEVLQTSIVVVLAATDPGSPLKDGEKRTGRYTLGVDQLTGDLLWKRNDAILEDPLLAFPIYEDLSLLVKTIDPISVGKEAGKAAASALLRFVPFGSIAADEINKPSGAAYLLDLMTGEYRWRREINDPALVEYYLSGGRLLERETGELHAVDLHSGEDVWTYDIDDYLLGIQGRHLVLAEDEDLRAFDLEAADKKSLRKNPFWKSKTPKSLDDVRALEVGTRSIYVAADDGFGCMDLSTGINLWAHKLEERGEPGSVSVSPDGSIALGAVYTLNNRSQLRIVAVDTTSGMEIGRFPAERTDKGKPTFLSIDADHSFRWVDSSTFILTTDREDVAMRVDGGLLRTVWAQPRPLPAVFPEDLELADALKKKQRRIGAALAVGGLALALIGGDIGSDVGKHLALVGGNLALLAGMTMLVRSGASTESIARGLPDSLGQRALARYKSRQQLLDPYIQIDVTQQSGVAGYKIRRLDLRTGEILDETAIATVGRIEADQAFRLAYQRPHPAKRQLQAIAIPGFSPELLAEFSSLAPGAG